MGHGPDSCPVTLPYQAHRLVLWLQWRVPSGKPTTRCPYPLFFIFTAFGSCSFSCSFFSSHAPNSHPLFLLIWLFPTSSLIPPPHCLATTATAPSPCRPAASSYFLLHMTPHSPLFSSCWLVCQHIMCWYTSMYLDRNRNLASYKAEKEILYNSKFDLHNNVDHQYNAYV